MKRILVDLDVVTVAKWDKGKNGDIEHLSKWGNIWLREQVEKFYLKASDITLTNEDVDEKINELGIDDKKILGELQFHNIKEEDAFMVLFTSIFDLDCLITFNKKHLRNRKAVINEVLKKNGLKTIKIIAPEEL